MRPERFTVKQRGRPAHPSLEHGNASFSVDSSWAAPHEKSSQHGGRAPRARHPRRQPPAGAECPHQTPSPRARSTSRAPTSPRIHWTMVRPAPNPNSPRDRDLRTIASHALPSTPPVAPTPPQRRRRWTLPRQSLSTSRGVRPRLAAPPKLPSQSPIPKSKIPPTTPHPNQRERLSGGRSATPRPQRHRPRSRPLNREPRAAEHPARSAHATAAAWSMDASCHSQTSRAKHAGDSSRNRQKQTRSTRETRVGARSSRKTDDAARRTYSWSSTTQFRGRSAATTRRRICDFAVARTINAPRSNTSAQPTFATLQHARICDLKAQTPTQESRT
jgi:hypothetical protein